MDPNWLWIYLIFFLIPLARILPRWFRRRRMQNYSKTPEKSYQSQFVTHSTDPTEKPIRNLSRPKTKDMLVLGELNRGAKNFEKLQKITGFERDELIYILDDLEKRGLMRVEERSGFFGTKIELYATDKGFKEYHS